MFKKKNPVKKLEVKHEDRGEVEIKINVQPLVKIELHESRVNGKPNKPEYKIMVGGRDCILLSEREYHELFLEILRHKEAGEIIHDISVVHAEEHAMHDEAHKTANGLMDALAGSSILEEIFKGKK